MRLNATFSRCSVRCEPRLDCRRQSQNRFRQLEKSLIECFFLFDTGTDIEFLKLILFYLIFIFICLSSDVKRRLSRRSHRFEIPLLLTTLLSRVVQYNFSGQRQRKRNPERSRTRKRVLCSQRARILVRFCRAARHCRARRKRQDKKDDTSQTKKSASKCDDIA